jgi:predicted peroxiredoxin
MLETAVTAVAHGHDVQVFFFGQGQIVCRREEIGAVAEVLEGISSTAELLDVDQLHT